MKINNKKQIDILDNQIDKLVYKLYNLTEEEIKIVEGVQETYEYKNEEEK